MKSNINYMLLLLTIAAASCKKDNYDPPGSKLSGHVVYKGEALGLEYDQVKFEVYQGGFGKTGPIDAVFSPDGTYSMLLFNGEYKFIIPNGQGPFKWKQTAAGAPDTTFITMQGSQVLDIEVTPFYMIRNPQLTASGGKVAGTFKIEKIITDASARDVEEVSLYINKTAFVSPANNVAVKTMTGSDITDPNNVNLSVAVPSLTQNYVFARIGLKIAGVEDRIFSPMVKIDL
ncbi:hypothetical protein A4H97_32235 [Niastella yeongjuensis]|uniref:DUF3823 domain-containing protein n=1 Tax=Niastella yeongjuensis TaxID=354355 RepID=A0A1V9EHY6_9BACT|nr:DUF3823 domain-containing protein [Niastella yeongjuensis]OQP45574.1 hypothetical protein A4H97_32235 [Niastella yeongjuensis]SEP46879.1 Protein of unknown function [Niastella yeongjuensis]